MRATHWKLLYAVALFLVTRLIRLARQRGAQEGSREARRSEAAASLCHDSRPDRGRRPVRNTLLEGREHGP
jgi:hypothetical protein